MTHSIKKLPGSKIELTVELGKEELQDYVAETEKRLANDARLDGFRPGKAPREQIRKQVGEAKIREQALALAVQSSLLDTVKQEKLEIISQEEIKIRANTGDKLVYRVVFNVFPEIQLGPYTGLGVKKNPVRVEAEEIQNALQDLRRLKTAGRTAPELNDEFTKGLGRFNSLTELKDSISQGLALEKEAKEKERVRLAILEKISAQTKVEPPPALVEERLNELLRDFDNQLHQQGKELGLYLAQIKKTQDDLLRDWQAKAETQVKMNLIAREVAKRQKLKVSDEEVSREITTLAEHYTRQGELEQLQQADPETVKLRIKAVLLNEKVFDWLEKNNLTG
ncbi:MAG: trigger factor [Patescibacteria group bacterium]